MVSLERRLARAIGLIDNPDSMITIDLTARDYIELERQAGQGVKMCHGYPVRSRDAAFSCVTYTSRTGHPVTITLPAIV